MAIPSIRPQIKRFLIAVVWAAFSLGYFLRFPLPAFFHKLHLILLAAVITLSAIGWGALLLRKLKPHLNASLEYLLFAALTGFGLLSFATALLGCFGLWHQAPTTLLVLAGLGLSWKEKKELRTLCASPSNLHERFPAPFLLLILGASLSLIMTFSPPIYYDSLVYHYALPQAYLQAGRWVGQPSLIYSAFPQLMEMLWTLGMLLGGDLLANLLGWVMAMVGISMLFAFARRFLSEEVGLWSAALLIIMPSYLLLSSGGYVDVGLTVYALASFYALYLWHEKPHAALLVLAGTLAGFSLGTKYTAGFGVALGALYIAVVARLQGRSAALKSLALYLGTALLSFSPWMLKNLHYVGNPVFPFFYKWSFKSLNPWVQSAAAGYFHGITEYAPRHFHELFKLLWDIATRGMDFGGGMDVIGDFGWSYLFVLLPVLWLARPLPQVLRHSLLYASLFFTAWGLSKPVLRFLLPIAPFLAFAAAYGLVQLKERRDPLHQVGRWLLGLLLLSNMTLFFEIADSLSLFRVPLGFETRENYLARKLKYYPAARFLDTLPGNTLTYVVGDQCSYYYNKPVLVTPAFNANPLTAWANESDTAADLMARLRARGITHLLINHLELRRLNEILHNFPWTPKGQDNWESLLETKAVSLYRDKNCEVLALR